MSLRMIVQTVLAHPFAGIVLWEPQLIQISNGAYRSLMGVKHPAGLGQPTRECWAKVWHINAPIYERMRHGELVSLEDAWFSLAYSPLRGENGLVAGVFLTIVETTRWQRAEAALRQGEEELAMTFERALWACPRSRRTVPRRLSGTDAWSSSSVIWRSGCTSLPYWLQGVLHRIGRLRAGATPV